MQIAVNPKTLVAIKEKARAKLEYDGTYLAWLFRQELESLDRIRSGFYHSR